MAFSIASNLALLGVVCLLLARKHVPCESAAQPCERVNSPVTPPAQSIHDDVEQEVTRPFRWSQIESTNYLTYISNLRAVGCPSQTVRDIVAADVHGFYAPKQELLREQEQRLGRSMETERMKLSQEEIKVTELMLVPPPSEGPMHSQARSSFVTETEKQAVGKPEVKVAVPLVYALADPASLGLDPARQAAVESLRDHFVTEVGGANQDPSDPAYLERWRTAQSRSDQSFKAFFGTSAFLILERERQRQAAEPGLER